MVPKQKRSVLFVCTGNICRSPTAEGVFRRLVEEAKLSHLIETDSAGTHGYHVGEAPDPRSQFAAGRRGYDLCKLRARKIDRLDFAKFNLIVAMDRDHFELLSRLAPPSHAHKLRMMMSYAPHTRHEEVPDPYYGGPEGFELVLDLLEEAARRLLDELRRDLGTAQLV